jgi:asparagine synthase (glutamine-hydrolysing)
MCGIMGVLGRALARHVAAGRRRYLSVLGHRGPDDHGWLVLRGAEAHAGRDIDLDGADALFLHRRLAVLDPTERGWQPFASPDRRHYLLYNGEIYNYLELREELEAAGHEFRSRCDTEVLLAACRQWGPEALPRLVGMFAFAIVDSASRELFLARDPFGIKPLYHTSAGGGFAFASEIKALLGLPGVSRRARPGAVRDYLLSGHSDQGEETFFEDIVQLLPGHVLRVELDDARRPRVERYGGVEIGSVRDLSLDDAAADLRRMFLRNVELHLRSDVRVGTALSGGIDSSSIVMAMRHVQGRSLDLHAFSYVAGEDAIDEERWIDVAGAAAGACVHKVRPTADELREDVDRLVTAHDEPFGSTSIYAQYRVFRLAHEQGVKVLLDGQGADELFGGYPPYLGAAMASLLTRGRLGRAVSLWSHALRRDGPAAWRHLVKAGWAAARPALAGRVAARPRLRPPDWLQTAWFDRCGVRGRMLEGPAHRDRLRDELHRTLVSTSLPALLRYEDRNSMAFSIESRVPFLTCSLASYVLSLPEEHIIGLDGTSKLVLRRAMRGLVPESILARRDKVGFATPERSWMRSLRPWVLEVLGSEAARRLPVFRHDALRRRVEALLDGTRRFDNTAWRWVNLVRWAELLDVRFDRA